MLNIFLGSKFDLCEILCLSKYEQDRTVVAVSSQNGTILVIKGDNCVDMFVMAIW